MFCSKIYHITFTVQTNPNHHLFPFEIFLNPVKLIFLNGELTTSRGKKYPNPKQQIFVKATQRGPTLNIILDMDIYEPFRRPKLVQDLLIVKIYIFR